MRSVGLLRLALFLLCFHGFGSLSLKAQVNPTDPMSPSEVTRRNRERFEPRTDAALAAADKRYFSWKASIELDPIDREMAARDLAEILFSEDLKDFRAGPKVKAFLMRMVEDLDNFMGKTPDPVRVEMLVQLEKAILKKFAEVEGSIPFKESASLRWWQAAWFGGVSVNIVVATIFGVYFAWKKIILQFPGHAISFKNWLVKNKNRLVLHRRLRRALKRDDHEEVRSCRAALRELRPEKWKLPSREKTTKFLWKAGFWGIIDLGVSAAVGTGGYFYFYRPLRAWRTQELFLDDQFEGFVMDRTRMSAPSFKPEK